MIASWTVLSVALFALLCLQVWRAVQWKRIARIWKEASGEWKTTAETWESPAAS